MELVDGPDKKYYKQHEPRVSRRLGILLTMHQVGLGILIDDYLRVCIGAHVHYWLHSFVVWD